MKICLTLESIPEIRGLTKQEQEQAWRTCAWDLLGSASWWLTLTKLWVLYMIVGSPMFVFGGYVMYQLGKGFPVLSWIVSIAGACVLGGAGAFFAHGELMRHMRPRLERYVKEAHATANKAAAL